MHRKKDIADALRAQADKLNFFIAVANSEGLQVKITITCNIPHPDAPNPAGIRQILEIDVQDLKTPTP